MRPDTRTTVVVAGLNVTCRNIFVPFFLLCELALVIMSGVMGLAPIERRRRPITFQVRLRGPSDRQSAPSQVGFCIHFPWVVVNSATTVYE